MRNLGSATFVLLSALAFGRLEGQPLTERFLRLVEAQGTAGHESEVREAVRAQLPAWTKPRVDEIGNLLVTVGSGEPQVALVATLDERGYVVSRITEDGYLRLHRPTFPYAYPLRDQLFVGQPVVVQTPTGRKVPGVSVTPSTHLAGLTEAAEVARIRNVQDLWVDVGARNLAEAEALGIRLLDPVALRERAQLLAGGRLAGVESRRRAGAQALVEILRGLPAGAAVQGTVTFAWVAQSQLGSRGLARLAREIQPSRAYLAGFELTPRRGAGERPPAPQGWEGVTLEAKTVPALFPETPVEIVDTHDIAALALDLATAAGLASAAAPGPPPSPVSPAASASQPPAGLSSPSLGILRELIELYGVSGSEGPVREAVLRRLPAWAKPRVDEKGNVTVSFGGDGGVGEGGKGGRELLFVAHLDEVGFEVAALREDGSASVRERGGMYLSLYEAHPVLVQTLKGAVPAVLTPRAGYEKAATAQPKVEELSLYFGTSSAAETRALGVAVGSSAGVRKKLEGLAGRRVTGRAMDDRVGSTALLLALGRLDPAKVANRVTFAWSVEEEVGLLGAAHLATYLHPEIVFAVDTFVSSDTPVDLQYLAHAELGAGPVLRGLDNATVVPAEMMTRIQGLAREAGLPLQIGVTQGGTDASAFSAGGAVDVGLSWPGRYSHSPVEVMDSGDLEALARLIARLAEGF